MAVSAVVALIVVIGAGSGAPAKFTTVSGAHLVNDSDPFIVKGATAHGLYGDPPQAIQLAQQAGLNTLELVEFDTQHHQLSDTESDATWKRLDAFIAAARQAGLHVILTLSEFGQSLQAAGKTMASGDWNNYWAQYLTFIATRRNTVSGVEYKNDPTIAMVQLWGEIPGPDSANPVGTANQMQAWYRGSFKWWHAVAPNILVSSGGFSHLNETNADGIPWQQIMSDANNATCDMEINSHADRDVTVPMVTNYCQSLGKPWFLSAWSSCMKPNEGSWDINDYSTDADMAAHVKDMYDIASGASPAKYPALGADFWNLGRATSNTCELGPQFPQTWARVLVTAA